jgi:hypothetical protein|tara:strand:+ start:324 stop:716 length:393 start_codon:yes stop_codon:yes gene_type:complete
MAQNINKIKDLNVKELKLLCVDLISKTIVELGQRKSDKEIVILATSLAEDLKDDFANLLWIDIEKSFKNGVRLTDEFHLSVKTYYKWIKTHRNLIWENETKEDEYKDKRLKYRSKKNTGLTTIKQHLING